MQVSDLGRETSGTFGPIQLALLPNVNQASSSLKTCLECSPTSFTDGCQSYKIWATAVRREYSRRRKLGRRTSGSGSSFWPSPRVSKANGSGEHGSGGPDLRTVSEHWPTPNPPNGGRTSNVSNYRDDGSKRQVDLGASAALWQTPGTDSFRSRGGDRKDEPGLDRQARMWATPAGRDVKGEYLDGSMVRNDGKARGDLLPDQASRFSRPTEPETMPDGPSYSETTPTSRPRLNVAFVAWLVGWPDYLVLSGYGCSETAWSHWWRRQRSALLRLDSHGNSAGQSPALDRR